MKKFLAVLAVGMLASTSWGISFNNVGLNPVTIDYEGVSYGGDASRFSTDVGGGIDNPADTAWLATVVSGNGLSGGDPSNMVLNAPGRVAIDAVGNIYKPLVIAPSRQPVPQHAGRHPALHAGYGAQVHEWMLTFTDKPPARRAWTRLSIPQKKLLLRVWGKQLTDREVG